MTGIAETIWDLARRPPLRDRASFTSDPGTLSKVANGTFTRQTRNYILRVLKLHQNVVSKAPTTTYKPGKTYP